MKKITELCTGCRACEQVCRKGAISLIVDKEGFLTSSVDQQLCVNCGLCAKICPQNSPVEKSLTQKVCAARLKDNETISKSASGGIFAGIAKAWISEGGIVVGVVFDKEWNAHHICAATNEQLDAILSSKYVQADTRATYTEVKHLLEDGSRVLYCGTGCQIGGLKAFLRKDFNNLLTIDIICHGVASPLLFKKYVNWLEKKTGYSIQEYNFRDKRGGWGLGYKYKYAYNNKTVSRSCTVDPYFSRFLEGHTLRECCYKCNYSTKERAGDFTIGDYWGIEKEHPHFFNTKGVSCVLINSNKGLAAWEKYEHLYFSIESSFDMVVRHNGNLTRPTKRVASIRDHIYNGIENDSNWFSHNFAAQFKPSIKTRIKAIMPKFIRFVAKKL